MSCGCASTGRAGSRSLAACAVLAPGVSAELYRTNAAMCAACAFAERDTTPAGLVPVGCTLGGSPLPQDRGGGCPRNRHAAQAGSGLLVRWLGVTWYGVPMPLRLLVAVHLWRWPRLPGCGCVKVLKDWAMGNGQ